MKQETPNISIVLPAYNNKRLAKQSVQLLSVFLRKHFDHYEIIVIDDGSLDCETLDPFTMPKGVTILRNKRNMGKGYSVKRGMLAATANCRVYTDIDLPYDLGFILEAYRIIKSNNCHFVTGDRMHPNSTQKGQLSTTRLCASYLFRKALPTLILGRTMDTQCGFKACSGLLAEHLFSLVTINRFAFDIEIFYLLSKQNVKTTSLPVCLVNAQESSVHVLWDGAQLSYDGLALPVRWHLGLHKSRYAHSIPKSIPRIKP